MLLLSLFLFSIVSIAAPLTFELSNELENHPSPYLAMHGKDPVHWQQWGAEALEKARQQNRLIYISSGYFSCHWCHVMHRESYSSAEIAAFLNKHFIPVKVDRELHPSLDAYLIEFVRQTNGSAGWPLNVFVTPQGYPLYGLTYAVPGDFQALLQRLSDTWNEQGEKASRLAREAAEFQLEAYKISGIQQPVDNALVNQSLLEQALEMADEFEGGFGSQNRFPMAPQLLALLDLVKHSRSQKLTDFLILTLDQIKDKGLRDHLNGGFFRYTVDPAWTEPHFEKMLYTQALLGEVYLKAAVILDKPEYNEVTRDTIDFVLKHMRSAQVHGFVSSYSAIDSNNREGGAYLWTQSELVQLLNEKELSVINNYWTLTDTPDVEMGDLPIVSQTVTELANKIELDPDQVRSLIGGAKSKMRKQNKISTMPIDHKVLTSWNALFLSTLSQAARQLNDSDYKTQANKLRNSLLKQAWTEQFIKRSLNIETSAGAAGLEDYVYMAKGFNDYAVLMQSEEDWYLGNLFAAKAWLLFYHSAGWKTGSGNLLPGMSGKAALPDSSLPAADAMLMQLSLQSDNKGIRQKAENAAGLMIGTVSQSPLQYASHSRWINQHSIYSR